MAESSLRQPCIPAPHHELGKCTALLALILSPGLLSQVPGRAGRVCALTPPRMKDYCASREAEQNFLLLTIFLQMCTVNFGNILASCNYPASPREEGTILQTNLISLNLVQNCLRLLGFVYILLVLPWPPRAGGSTDTLQARTPFRKAPLSSSALPRGLVARGFAPSNIGFAEERRLVGLEGTPQLPAGQWQERRWCLGWAAFSTLCFSQASKEKGKQERKVSGCGNLLVPVEVHVWPLSGDGFARQMLGDRAVAQSWANLSSSAPSAA